MPGESKTQITSIRRRKAAAEKYAAPALTGDQAAQIMWILYRDRRGQFVPHIRKHRDTVLAGLIQGLPVEKVFAPFFRL